MKTVHTEVFDTANSLFLISSNVNVIDIEQMKNSIE